jgi:hypothetical protein
MVTGRHLTDGATMPPAMPALPIARNTALLSAALGAHPAMLQLAAAVASITLGGFVLTAAGVTALAIGAVVLVVAPALWILYHAAPRPVSWHATSSSSRRRA